MLSAFRVSQNFNDLIDLNYAEIANSLGGKGYRVATREQLNQHSVKPLASVANFS